MTSPFDPFIPIPHTWLVEIFRLRGTVEEYFEVFNLAAKLGNWG
jgi:hypothetical protein